MRRFVGWFEQNSVSVDVKTMAKQQFNAGPRDDPPRNAWVNYLELAPSPLSTPATPEKHQQFIVDTKSTQANVDVKKIEI